MRRTLLAAAAVSLLGLGTPALFAGGEREGDGAIPRGKDGAPLVVGKEVGKDVPDIQLSLCLNDDGRTTVADHRGQVVILDLWATTCGPCKGLIPSFTKEQQSLGPKGLQVIGITGESPETLTKWIAQQNTAEIGYKMASGSSGGLQSPGTVPYCFVIGVDGKVLWQGHGKPPSGIVEEALKKVVPPTAEAAQARAAKALDRASGLASEKRFLQASELYAKVAKDHAGTPAAATAAESLRKFEADADIQAEIKAQKLIAKIIGGTCYPVEKLSKKERALKVAQLEGVLAKEAAKSPGAQEIAKHWTKMLGEDYKPER